MNRWTMNRWTTAILAMMALLAGSIGPQAARAQGDAAAPKKDGLRVFHVGNSHTDSVRDGLMPIAVMAGHPKHFFSTSIILGAPLRWIRDHDKECREQPWTVGLGAPNVWDAATLQVYAAGDADDVAAAVTLSEALYKGNPKCQVYFYTIWPGGNDDWENPPKDRGEAGVRVYVDAVAKAFPDAPKPRILPTSLVVRELGRLADAGQLPHVPSRFKLLADGGHLSDYGNYAVNMTICATLYQEPPFAYPTKVCNYKQMSKEVKVVDPDKARYEIQPETADVIKRMVWDVLSTFPEAGVEVGMVIADRSLPPAIVGQPYSAALKALNAQGKPAWSLTKGTLPEGLKLGADGALSGKASKAGDYDLTVQVADAGKKFEKAFLLTVSADLPPAVADAGPAPVPLDEYVFRPLKVEGGVGHLTWTLAGGKLPNGVVLLKPGILMGTPGEAGEFTFQVKVEDSHPAGARSAEKEFKWTVGAPSPNALLVKKTSQPMVLDGTADEPFWAFDQKIEKKVTGTPTKSATFAAAWFEKPKNSKDETGLYLAIRVTDGPAGKTPKDAVELFIDGLHNREVIYNADDTLFVINRKGECRSLKGKPNWFIKAKATEVEGGYVLEVLVPTNYFLGEGNWLPFAAKSVYGFDLAVDEGDKDLSQTVYRGTAKDADDTSGFANLVLTETPAPGGEAPAAAPAPAK